MWSFFEHYPYFFLCCLLTAAGAACLALARGQRAVLLVSALLSAPYGFYSFVFVPAYWRPVRIYEGFTGLEDLLFSFVNGATVMLLSFWPWRKQIAARIRPSTVLLRYVMWTGAGMAVGRSLTFTGMSNMNTILAAIVVVGGFILRLRPSYWRFCLLGAPSFCLFYGLALWLSYQLFPHFVEQWQPWVRQGSTFFGLPAKEVFWSLGYGACWPLIMAHAMNIEVFKTAY